MFYTQKLLHKEVFIQSSLDTEKLAHTLDKNGSLYDPSGTESWNMQTSLDF